MPKAKGSENGNWNGGRTISSHGYVLVRVGTEHHLADVRGYAYEHRIIAEETLGRRLLPGEIVHHLDHNKRNNSPENLEVVESIAAHRFQHRAKNDGKRSLGEPNHLVFCECGCGARFTKYDTANRPRRFVSGHNARNRDE